MFRLEPAKTSGTLINQETSLDLPPPKKKENQTPAKLIDSRASPGSESQHVVHGLPRMVGYLHEVAARGRDQHQRVLLLDFLEANRKPDDPKTRNPKPESKVGGAEGIVAGVDQGSFCHFGLTSLKDILYGWTSLDDGSFVFDKFV